MVATDERFWNEQVRHPAAAWMASGAHGAPKPPAEALASAHLPGLAADGGEGDDRNDRIEEDRPIAIDERRSKSDGRWAAEREELTSFRGQRSKGEATAGRQSLRVIC